LLASIDHCRRSNLTLRFGIGCLGSALGVHVDWIKHEKLVLLLLIETATVVKLQMAIFRQNANLD
jgi:hypothetical protein